MRTEQRVISTRAQALGFVERERKQKFGGVAGIEFDLSFLLS